jgi:membrane-bound lytic murein transglycosylase D
MPVELRRRRECLTLGAWALGLLTLVLPLAAVAAPAPADEARERVGPLRVSSGGRDSVRGGRPDGATIHETHAPRTHDPDAAQREDLATFEREQLATTPPTIIDTAPEPWMAALHLPDIPVRWNQQTVAYLKYFRDDPRGQALIRGWIRRMSRYEHILRPILKEVGVPEDLVFVAMAESGFNPKVRSRVGAAGMWQFMEGTGRVYGLERDYWVDERHDIERATYAAATYLKDLRVRFGSWEMALAGFNAGYGLVMTSVARANSNNFWALCEVESGLPHATTMYVPKIIAAALVGRNRAVFGVGPELQGTLPPVRWGQVEVGPATSITAVAKAIDEDPALLEELNAQLLRKRTPPGRRYALRVPQGKVHSLAQSAGRIASDAGDTQQYTVRYGETLAEIARRLGTSEAALRRLNDLDDLAELERDTVLLVPSRGGKVDSTPKPRPRAAVPALAVGPEQRRVFFEVTRSTTPRGLSEAFGAPWERIVAWNDLDPQARLQPGQVLQLLVPRSFDARVARVIAYEADQVDLMIRGSREHLEASLRDRGLSRRGYHVRKGDDLPRIGKKFDLSDGDLARINGFARDSKPRPGTVIVVYVDRAHERGTVEAPPPRNHHDPETPTPTNEAVDADVPSDMDAEPGATEPATEPDADGPSTEGHNKLPGKQGWSRKPSKAGKDRKDRHDSKPRPDRKSDQDAAPKADTSKPPRPARKASSPERSRLPGAPAEDGDG